MPHVFNRNMLPILGIKWVQFGTLNEAQRFIRWVERETENDNHPCEAFVENEVSGMYEVKVSNW